MKQFEDKVTGDLLDGLKRPVGRPGRVKRCRPPTGKSCAVIGWPWEGRACLPWRSSSM